MKKEHYWMKAKVKKKMKTKTIKVRPEITYGCPFCGLNFNSKLATRSHIHECYSEWLIGFSKDIEYVDINIKFLKPR